MDVGSVVWLNSGQGPWTVVTVNVAESYVICSDGNSNKQFPTACLSTSPTGPVVNQQVMDAQTALTVKAASIQTATVSTATVAPST